jgi:mannose-6-phosphate isomerase-like protein (cupin superfamily)
VAVERIAWTTSTDYPEALQHVLRWGTLIGNEDSGARGIPQDDVLMGIMELDAGGFYPSHAHVAPEIYFVLSGRAQWTVADETFIAAPGTAIYHAPNAPHRMVNLGTEPLRAIWFWWAPGGRNDVLKSDVVLLEPMPSRS